MTLFHDINFQSPVHIIAILKYHDGGQERMPKVLKECKLNEVPNSNPSDFITYFIVVAQTMYFQELLGAHKYLTITF